MLRTIYVMFGFNYFWFKISFVLKQDILFLMISWIISSLFSSNNKTKWWHWRKTVQCNLYRQLQQYHWRTRNNWLGGNPKRYGIGLFYRYFRYSELKLNWLIYDAAREMGLNKAMIQNKLYWIKKGYK